MSFRYNLKINSGADLHIKGRAALKSVVLPPSETYTIKPGNFFYLNTKLLLKEGAKVKKGTPLFFDKGNPEVKFVSPISGTVQKIVRGKRRRVLDVIVHRDEKQEALKFDIPNLKKCTRKEIVDFLLEVGLWPFLSQRPYGIIANPTKKPKSIFISLVDKRPLGVDFDFILKDKIQDFQRGIEVLSKLTNKIYLGFPSGYQGELKSIKGATFFGVSGPHPAGNSSVHINKIDPLNYGEYIWTINPEDIANIGESFATGEFTARRTIAVAGNGVGDPKYFKVTIGHELLHLLQEAKVNMNQDNRYINGDLLSGEFVDDQDHIGYLNNLISVIPEGNQYRMFGWLPFKDNSVLSTSRTSFNWLKRGNKTVEVNTNLNGEERALVVTGEMEKVFPMDIYPLQLIKACMVEDIEKMEALGIFEVVPEDFGLIDFTNSSKLEAQEIIKSGLELMIKEVG